MDESKTSVRLSSGPPEATKSSTAEGVKLALKNEVIVSTPTTRSCVLKIALQERKGPRTPKGGQGCDMAHQHCGYEKGIEEERGTM